MTSRPIAIRKGEVHRRPVVGSCVGNSVMKSSSFGTVVVGKTVNRSVPVVVVVTATAVVVGATVVVAAIVTGGASVVVLPAMVVVVPRTVVVVVGAIVVVVGAIVVVVVGATVVVVVGATVVVVVGAIVVVVVGATVVVVVEGAIVVEVVLVVVVGAAVVVVTGATIAPLLMDRSWLPTEQFLSEHMKSMRRMWYGEPLMEDADFPAPQSACDAMCPDQESTIVGTDAVKYTVVDAVLVPANVPVCA
jgi:hypothetical protein